MQDNSADPAPQGALDVTTFSNSAQSIKLGRRTSANFKGRTLANSISTIVGWLIPSFIFLGLTPFLVHNIGQEGYGIFTITTILTGYVSLMNFGFGQAVTKHVAQYAAVDDVENLRLTVSAGLIIFPAIGLIGGILIFALSDWLVQSVFKVVPAMRGDAIIAVQLSSLGFFLIMLTSFLEGLAMGMNHFDIPNIIRILRVSLSSGLMVLGVLTGYGLTGVMVGNIAGQFISTAVSVVMTFRLLPRPRLRGAAGKVKELFNYGKFVFVSRALNTTASQVGTTALGILSSMTSVTQFSIPTKIVTTLLDIFQRLFELLFPMSAALDSQNQKNRLSQIFVSLTRWQLLIFTPLIILTLFHGRWLLRFWLGPEFVNEGYAIMLITVVYDIISALTAVPSHYALGLGHPEYSSRFSIIRLVLVLSCIYPFVKWHGAVGVAEATFVSSLQGLAFIIIIAHRLLKLNLWQIFRSDVLKLGGLMGGFLVLYVLLGNKIDSYDSIFIQAGIGLVLMALYLFAAIVFKILPIDEGKKLLNREFWKTI